MSEPLVCPSCALTYPLEERFCAKCGMPLVYSGTAVAEGGGPITEQHERARKIKPQLAEGELVKVAWGRNQAEAEFIQGLLLEEGVPSITRRTRGFDVPDFLAAGPRDILAPQSGAAVARQVLLQAEVVSDEEPGGAGAGGPSPLKLALGLLAGIAVVLVIVLVMNALS